MQQPEQFANEEDHIEFASLKYNNTVTEYLSQFDERCHDDFLWRYIFHKKTFMAKGEEEALKVQAKEEEFIALAQLRLLDIQVKKLFDVMLQWNAEQLKIEGIDVMRDFHRHESFLTSCPFITPISQQDFDLYIEYVKSPEFEPDREFKLYGMSEYLDKEWYDENIKPSLEEEGEEEYGVDPFTGEDRSFPAWFAFHNQATGNDKFMALPQIRTSKENSYVKLTELMFFEISGTKEEEEDLRNGIIEATVDDEEEEYEDEDEQDEDEQDEDEHDEDKDEPGAFKYSLMGMIYSEFKNFITACEPGDVLDKFQKYYDNNPHELLHDTPEAQINAVLDKKAMIAFDKLRGTKETIPAPADEDWRKSLIAAYDKYRTNSILRALPVVYEDYCMRINSGLGFDWQKKWGELDQHLVQHFRNRILHGRIKMGEPANFDF